MSDDSIETLSNWSVGDQILIGGVWREELDAQHREVSPCNGFTLYNYTKGNFVFTYLP